MNKNPSPFLLQEKDYGFCYSEVAGAESFHNTRLISSAASSSDLNHGLLEGPFSAEIKPSIEYAMNNGDRTEPDSVKWCILILPISNLKVHQC